MGFDSCNFLGSTVEPGAWETAPKGSRTKQSRTLGTPQNLWRAGVGKISSVSGQKAVVAPRAHPAHGRPFINFLNSTSKFAKSPSWRSSRLPNSTCLPRTRHVWDVVKVVKLDLLFSILKENDPELVRVATVCVLSPPPVRGSKVHACRLHLSRGHAFGCRLLGSYSSCILTLVRSGRAVVGDGMLVCLLITCNSIFSKFPFKFINTIKRPSAKNYMQKALSIYVFPTSDIHRASDVRGHDKEE